MVTKLTDLSFAAPITDVSAVPTVPASETALRGYLQGPSNELQTDRNGSVKTAVNAIIDIIPKIVSSVAGTNTITGTIDPAPSTYADLSGNGTLVILKAANTNTGAVTLNLNSRGAVEVKKNGSAALVAGDIVSGSVYLFEHDGANFQLLNPANAVIKCRAYRNANTSISDNTTTALGLNQERYDTDSIHDNATNNTRLTCKTAGEYAIFGHLVWAANATGIRSISIRLNGATVIAAITNNNTGGADMPQSIATNYTLAVNDYVELMAYQNSGGALNVNYSADHSPEFGMTRVG